MACLQVNFVDSLNDFLPPDSRGRWSPVSFQGRQTLKHLIESLRVPHPEVGFILVDDHPAGLDHLAQDASRMQVFPYQPGDKRMSPDELRFILDGHLGKLASYLRILGFDSSYQSDAADEALATVSADEKRILLTRDRGLLKRCIVEYGYCVRHQDPHQQLLEIIHRYNLLDALHPFSRCPRCNGLLSVVDKDTIAGQLRENTRKFYHQFWQCQACAQIYWHGSHHERIQGWLSEILANPLSRLK